MLQGLKTIYCFVQILLSVDPCLFDICQMAYQSKWLIGLFCPYLAAVWAKVTYNVFSFHKDVRKVEVMCVSVIFCCLDSSRIVEELQTFSMCAMT